MADVWLRNRSEYGWCVDVCVCVCPPFQVCDEGVIRLLYEHWKLLELLPKSHYSHSVHVCPMGTNLGLRHGFGCVGLSLSAAKLTFDELKRIPSFATF